MKAILLGLAALVAATAAQAADVAPILSGDRLYRDCAAWRKAPGGADGDAGYCLGALITIAMYEKGRAFCWRDGTTLEQIADRYLEYVAANPDARGQNYVDATIRALGAAYPCAD